MHSLHKFYRQPGLTSSQEESIKSKVKSIIDLDILDEIKTELCYYIGADTKGKNFNFFATEKLCLI